MFRQLPHLASNIVAKLVFLTNRAHVPTRKPFHVLRLALIAYVKIYVENQLEILKVESKLRLIMQLIQWWLVAFAHSVRLSEQTRWNFRLYFWNYNPFLFSCSYIVKADNMSNYFVQSIKATKFSVVYLLFSTNHRVCFKICSFYSVSGSTLEAATSIVDSNQSLFLSAHLMKFIGLLPCQDKFWKSSI